MKGMPPERTESHGGMEPDDVRLFEAFLKGRDTALAPFSLALPVPTNEMTNDCDPSR